ncbi:MAG: S8 family serine peptidase, partial [Thermoanaerobaculia bacterium]
MKKTILGFALVLLVAGPALAQADRFADVIVSLDEDFGSHAQNEAFGAQVAAEHGVTAKFTYGTVFTGFAARVPEARLDALRNDPRVLSVSFDGPVHAFQPCNRDNSCDDDDDDDGGGQTVPWGIARVGADTNSNEASGIHVYIIDSGIDADHRDLQGNLGNGFAVETCKGGGCAATWDDDNGHGTHVAGTVGAIDNDEDVLGMASQVTLHAVKVLDKRGSGTFSGIVEGVDWVAGEVAARGAAAVGNMSLGGGGSKSGECDNGSFSGDDNLHRALCEAAGVGVVMAVAAGNDGADAEGSVPAAFDDAVITVSATEEGDDWPDFSNWGDNSASWTSNNSAPVAIAAPGVDVLSTW